MKVGIYTLGCKVNTYESEFIVSELLKNNYEICNFTDICDIYIVNTCTVTNTSDIKSRKILKQAKKRNPNACIIALGCYIQANPNCKLEYVDITVGNKDKSKIIDLIREFFKNKEKIDNLHLDLGTSFEDMEIDKFHNRTRAFIKIQDGCENFCSYCIIPFVRGKCRSKDFSKVLSEITNLTNNGFKEVVLTGIHTGNYGVDINTNFYNLLKEIVKIKKLERLRISSIEITELTDDILELIKDEKVIVNHFHIPLQAGSNKILKLMNRKYDTTYYKEITNKLRSIKPDVSITTDIIVGHPLEDDETFLQSLDFIRDINFSKIHVFPYSKRDGTKASEMEQVDVITKKERARTLLKLSKELEENYMKRFIDRKLEVLIERNKEGYSYGHTTNYLQVKIKGNYKPNTLVNVRIASTQYPYCLGEYYEV